MNNVNKIADAASGGNEYPDSKLQKGGIILLPEAIRGSSILSAENILKLSAVSEIPLIDPSFEDKTLKNIFQYFSINPDEMEREIHLYANTLLDENKVAEAWQVLLAVS